MPDIVPFNLQLSTIKISVRIDPGGKEVIEYLVYPKGDPNKTIIGNLKEVIVKSTTHSVPAIAGSAAAGPNLTYSNSDSSPSYDINSYFLTINDDKHAYQFSWTTITDNNHILNRQKPTAIMNNLKANDEGPGAVQSKRVSTATAGFVTSNDKAVGLGSYNASVTMTGVLVTGYAGMTVQVNSL
jgi:hypothetical protein